VTAELSMRTQIKVVLALLLFTVSCQSAQRQDHTSILKENGKTVRVVLLDIARKPIAGVDVELIDSKCEAPNCATAVVWNQKSGADGSVTIPRNLVHETTLIGTRANEPRELQATSWDEEQGMWRLRLIGRVATVCSRYDSSRIIFVAEDWASAQLESSGDFGLMSCFEAKDAFRTCQGPQIPDAGFSATLTRNGENISARLTGETIAGPKEFAQLECYHFARAQVPPHDVKNWIVEYSLTGGIAFFNRHLRLANTGELTVSANPDTSRTLINTHAPAELVAKINEFLKNAQPEHPTTGPIHPDSLNSSLALISGGSKYDLEVPDDIGKALDDSMESVLKTAVVGTWWESEWKLCRPAAQLTADQVDLPIESLIFLDNGQYSVTWKGGGARAYGDPTGKIPHTAVPDYSGKYAIQPDHSSIHLTFEPGIYTPRDFSGDGVVWIDDNKLVLRNVWLGTYKAKQKPDICEMTFKRTSG